MRKNKKINTNEIKELEEIINNTNKTAKFLQLITLPSFAIDPFLGLGIFYSINILKEEFKIKIIDKYPKNIIQHFERNNKLKKTRKKNIIKTITSLLFYIISSNYVNHVKTISYLNYNYTNNNTILEDKLIIQENTLPTLYYIKKIADINLTNYEIKIEHSEIKLTNTLNLENKTYNINTYKKPYKKLTCDFEIKNRETSFKSLEIQLRKIKPREIILLNNNNRYNITNKAKAKELCINIYNSIIKDYKLQKKGNNKGNNSITIKK